MLPGLRRAHSEIRRAPGIEIAQRSLAELGTITMPTKAGPEYRPSHSALCHRVMRRGPTVALHTTRTEVFVGIGVLLPRAGIPVPRSQRDPGPRQRQ